MPLKGESSLLVTEPKCPWHLPKTDTKTDEAFVIIFFLSQPIYFLIGITTYYWYIPIHSYIAQLPISHKRTL